MFKNGDRGENKDRSNTPKYGRSRPRCDGVFGPKTEVCKELSE